MKFPNLMHCAGCEHLTTIFLSLSEIGQGPCELALGEFTYNIIDKLIELQYSQYNESEGKSNL